MTMRADALRISGGQRSTTRALAEVFESTTALAVPVACLVLIAWLATGAGAVAAASVPAAGIIVICVLLLHRDDITLVPAELGRYRFDLRAASGIDVDGAAGIWLDGWQLDHGAPGINLVRLTPGRVDIYLYAAVSGGFAPSLEVSMVGSSPCLGL